MNNKHTLSAVSPEAQQHSDALKKLIKKQIQSEGGSINFAKYMHACLYAPGYGYYSAGSHKIGEQGDFTTAPEISSFFGYSIANHIIDVFAQKTQKHILEFGAGSGQLAIDIMTYLEKSHELPEFYYILEISADLRQRQQQYIRQLLPEHIDRFVWLDELPEQFEGVIVANEVCDAMPVNLIKIKEHQLYERHVCLDNNHFAWRDMPVTDNELKQQSTRLQTHISTDIYETEIHLATQQWLRTVAQSLKKGAFFIIDYGYSFNTFYNDERKQGTLCCYYRHQLNDDPFHLPGLQDITAHTEFTTLADIAFEQGLHVAGFHEQSDFLMAGGITDIAAAFHTDMPSAGWLQQSAGLKQLLMPSQMGQQFKVLSLTKNLELLARLSINDRRYQL
jgi:SAM-dependent MidA family methyltransferase